MAIQRVTEFLHGAWTKLPVETLVVATAAVGAIGLVHDADQIWFVRLVLAGLVVAPLAFAAHRLGRRRQALVIGGIAAGAVAALVAALPTIRAAGEPRFTWPYGLTLLAAMLVPFVANARQLARFVRRFFEETTTWGLLCGAAVAAVAVVAAALDTLFDLSVDRPMLDAFIVVIAGFVLVYLHRLLDDDPARSGRMPELWRRLATTIGAPFVSVMLAILVVYEITAGIRGELPRNTLSPLILAAGFVGFLSTLIMSSVVREDVGTAVLAPADPHRWMRRRTIRLARAFPLVLLALLPMAAWALWLRIDQYGLTPFRVVRGMGLVCLATMSVIGTVRWLRGRAPLGWEVPAVIIAFALATAFGPTSAIRLSIASQRDLLARQLDAAGAGRVVAATTAATRLELDDKDYAKLHDAVAELSRLGGSATLAGVLSGALERCADHWRADDCLEGLGIHARDITPVSSLELTSRGRFEPSPGELSFVELRRSPGEAAAYAPAADGELGVTADAVTLHEARPQGRVEIARGSLAATLANPAADSVLSPTWIPLVDASGAVVAKLAIHRLELRQTGNVREVTHLTGAIVWPAPAR